MSKETFIKELRELVDQIEALPESVAMPDVEFLFPKMDTVEELRAVRKLMRSTQHKSSGDTHWVQCNARRGIEVASFYSLGLLDRL